MWNIFKITNLFWLLTSTYIWVTALFNQGPILIVVNLIMVICLSMMPIKPRVDAKSGMVLAAMLLVGLWNLWIDGPVMGLTTVLMFLPVLWLLQLPLEYKEDLLRFCTKWYAIMLIPSIICYWLSLFMTLPSIGFFQHPNYKPFVNHVFYIKTTVDYGTLVRFNAFFLEPGHQALLSTFIMMANRFRFRSCPWLWVLLVCTFFSFSLAGYLLLALGYTLLQLNTPLKAVVAATLAAAAITFALTWDDGNNAVNELIIARLEQDENRGIKGNNRVDYTTDYIFAKMMKSSDSWIGIKEKTNMDMVAGAGYKIYIINYGLIGTLLALLFYISVIPPHPDKRYTIAFLLVIILCFMQRAYPGWYSWLFPYVTGIYIEAERKFALSDTQPSQSYDDYETKAHRHTTL